MRFDIAILGSGPAACAVAIRASRAGMRVAVIGQCGAKRYAKTPETVPGLASTHFEELGLEPQISNFISGSQYLMSSAWGTDRLSARSSILDVGGPGFFIDRTKFDMAILTKANKSDGVTVINGTIRYLKRDKAGWAFRVLPTLECLHAEFVVDASGYYSSLASLIGVKRLVVDKQICIEAQAITNGYSKAIVESSPDGWWFSAPIGENLAGITWFTDVNTARNVLRSREIFRSNLMFVEHIVKDVEFLPDLKPITRVSETSFLSRFAGEGWVAIGDAAITPDPLSSQGVYAALESSLAALDSIVAYLHGKRDSLQAYEEYQRRAVKRLVRERQKFYGMEERWKQSTFWQHRSSNMPAYAI